MESIRSWVGLWKYIDCKEFMKIWWFKELKEIVSRITECDGLRKVGDEWWMFKKWVLVFNRVR